ncbi:hypothetical protein M747DRAFT_161229 [Aspergillus niger ATCC 13496]|uniref:Uncharacterized protein n=1 Tax=Aspergillus niger ATCC 13496 TaxID=1353008 RepID=A0A370BG09_ASPNG|nr:hypothetical protein M747DRAFT_161229 [Aspergillus niger ATCC 13496]
MSVLEVVQGSRSRLHRAGWSRFIAAVVEHAKDAGRHGWWTAYLDVCSQLRCVDAISPSISAGDFMLNRLVSRPDPARLQACKSKCWLAKLCPLISCIPQLA